MIRKTFTHSKAIKWNLKNRNNREITRSENEKSIKIEDRFAIASH